MAIHIFDCDDCIYFMFLLKIYFFEGSPINRGARGSSKIYFWLINSFMTEVPIINESVHWFAMPWTGFYVIGTSVMKELTLDYWTFCIEHDLDFV